MIRLRSLLLLGLLVAVMFVSGCKTCGPMARYEFALIGDVPYTDEQVTNLFPNLIREINGAPLAFVIHAGDIKAGATPCTDETLLARRDQFQTIRHPLIFVPGDNEWTDCHTKSAGEYQPEERLDRLRDWFMPDDYSLGLKKIPLARQSSDTNWAAFRENVRWSRGSVTFAGFNVPGAVNNFGAREFTRRNAANVTWLRETFANARQKKSHAIMLVIQANPFPERGSTNRLHRGFREFIAALEEETIRFQKPVVLVHGDSHYFRIDKPLVGSRSRRRLENFTRVETFGNPDVHWLRVSVDPRREEVFAFREEIIGPNRVRH